MFNPSTGTYELRSEPAADDSRNTYGLGDRTAAPRRRTRDSRQPTDRQDYGTESYIPPQRSRRAGDTEHSADAQDDGGHRRAGGRAGRRKAPAQTSGKRRALQWGGGILGMLLVAGCAGGAWLYYDLNSNINKIDVGDVANPASDGPLNILLIGTDARKGKGNTGYGDAGSVGHADTSLVFHVSKDRSNASVLSIPRDLRVDIPDCEVSGGDGKVIPGSRNVRFNESLGQSGRDVGCTMHTVESLTGIDLNHVMMADFNAVKDLSTAVGGVEVCLAKDINDPKSHLNLSAGRHTIQGEDALAFVRTRYSVGFGSDLSRIGLQQQFLSAMIRKMKSSGTLTDPGKLLDLAETATKALTVDKNLGSVQKLMTMAKDLRRVDTDKITFLTVPVLDNPNDPATVILDEKKADPIFRMVQQDKSLTKVDAGKKKKKKGGKSADLDKVEKAPASEVRVDVLNGGAPPGAAQQTLTWMQTEQGMPLSTNAGNASEEKAKTTLEYAPNQASQAATLAELMGLPDSALKESSTDAGADESMTLTLGADFVEPGRKLEAPDKLPDDVEHVNAGDKSLCAE